MSGLCPFAVHRIIPPGSSDPAIRPRVAILHVDAGNASSLYDYFKNRSGGIESHFHVQTDGGLEQYRDIYWQADANHHANDFAVSIETQGYGAGEWTDAQLATIKRLLLWLNKEAGIPLVKCPKWDGAGVGYHIQFGSPGYWTPVAKSCPGPDRVKQFDNVLVPWMSSNPTSPKGLRMDKEVKAAFDNLAAQNRKILDRLAKTAAIRSSLATLRKQGRVDQRDLDAIIERLDELAAADE